VSDAVVRTRRASGELQAQAWDTSP
jgi:hypothetical protein